MGIRARQILISVLVMIFAGQTWLVYVDPAGRQQTLSPLAASGQTLWRANNCQSCHQLFGFGGFLGPDLTNAIDELSAERLQSILTIGAGQMPAFHLTSEARSAIAGFLREIDATGVSQPRLGEIIPAGEFLQQLVELEGELPGDVARGWRIAQAQNCIACHLPNRESLHRATDLTTIAATVDPERLFEVLRDGIPDKAMPRLYLGPRESADVLAFLSWMNARGAELRDRFEHLASSSELSISQLPWFEY